MRASFLFASGRDKQVASDRGLAFTLNGTIALEVELDTDSLQGDEYHLAIRWAGFDAGDPALGLGAFDQVVACGSRRRAKCSASML